MVPVAPVPIVPRLWSGQSWYERGYYGVEAMNMDKLYKYWIREIDENENVIHNHTQTQADFTGSRYFRQEAVLFSSSSSDNPRDHLSKEFQNCLENRTVITDICNPCGKEWYRANNKTNDIYKSCNIACIDIFYNDRMNIHGNDKNIKKYYPGDTTLN